MYREFGGLDVGDGDDCGGDEARQKRTKGAAARCGDGRAQFDGASWAKCYSALCSMCVWPYCVCVISHLCTAHDARMHDARLLDRALGGLTSVAAVAWVVKTMTMVIVAMNTDV